MEFFRIKRRVNFVNEPLAALMRLGNEIARPGFAELDRGDVPFRIKLNFLQRIGLTIDKNLDIARQPAVIMRRAGQPVKNRLVDPFCRDRFRQFR